MTIGFCGSQNGMNSFQENEVLRIFDNIQPQTLHHGDTVGADSQCHYDFLRWHARNDYEDRVIIIHPPVDFKKRAFVDDEKKIGNSLREQLLKCKHSVKIITLEPFAYLERNRHIVDAVEKMIATPKEVEHTLRSGTWATIRYAWKQKKEVRVIPPLFAA